MWSRLWLSPSRQLLIVLAIMLIPGAAGIWLTWRIIDQDRSLARQRSFERLESVADRIVAASQQSLSELESQFAGDPPQHLVLVIARRESIETKPPGALPYYPVLPAAAEPPVSAFAEAEKLEFQVHDPAKAIDSLRRLSRDPSADVRAGALLRLGRNLRKTGEFDRAMQAYDDLAKLGTTRVAGLPAALVAQEARCTLLEQQGKKSELAREATLFHENLTKGRWPLLRGAYQFHIEEARRWMGGPAHTEAERRSAAMAGALEWLWHEWRTGAAPQRQRKFLSLQGVPVLLAWQYRPDHLAALLAGPEYLEQAWKRTRDFPSVRVGLTDQDGNLVLGSAAGAGSPQVVRTSDTTGLPWILRISSADPDRDLADVAARRRLSLGGFALIMLVLIIGTYFSLRAISRELAWPAFNRTSSPPFRTSFEPRLPRSGNLPSCS